MSDTAFINRASKWWPIVFRAGLYFAIEALPGIAKGCHEFGEDAKKINGWVLAAFALEAVYHGCVGLRAYFDGSATRLAPPKQTP